MRFELLYFDDCPSWQTALDNLKAVFGANVQCDLLRVETQTQAEAERFVGSPTIRIDGDDLFPLPQTDYALGCRVYLTPEGLRGWPTAEMIRAAYASRSSAAI